MNSFSHWKLGTILWQQQLPLAAPLQRAAFLWGTVSPDFTPELLFVPHKAPLCLQRIEAILQNLNDHPASAMEWSVLSHQLGVLCHYMADYFCYAHNEGFQGSMRQHVAYEAALQQSLLCGAWSRVAPLPAMCRTNIPATMKAGHEAYLSYRTANTADIEYAFRYCYSLLACILRERNAPFAYSPAVSYS